MSDVFSKIDGFLNCEDVIVTPGSCLVQAGGGQVYCKEPIEEGIKY